MTARWQSCRLRRWTEPLFTRWTARPPPRLPRCAHLDEFPKRPRQEAAQPRRPLRLAALPQHAERDDREAYQREHERKDDAVLEHAPGEVAEIAGDAQPAENREHAPPEHRTDQDHQHVDATVGKLA